MLKIVLSNAFKREFKRALKRGHDQKQLQAVITLLANNQPLPAKYRDHALTGSYHGARECHIKPDWLLIYQINKNTLTLFLIRTGSHSDLFQ